MLHLGVFLSHIDWSAYKAPVPVELGGLTPKALEQIREKWKKLEAPKSWLLADPAKAETAAPTDARFFSDKNRREEH